MRKKQNKYKYAYSLFQALAAIFLVAQNVQAAPAISSVAGQIRDGQNITIDGSGFGSSGPTIKVFDDFNDGVDGQIIPTASQVGSWTTTTGSPTYVTDTRGMAALLVNENAMNQLIAKFAGTTEFFASYAFKIPDGYNFPNTSIPGTFPSTGQISSLKTSWLFDGDTGYQGDDDYILPCQPDGTWWKIASNDGIWPGDYGIVGQLASSWFEFGQWNRFSAYLKGGTDPTVDNGTMKMQGVSSKGQYNYLKNTHPLFDGDDNAYDNNISQWTNFNIPGWYRRQSEGGVTANVRMIFDDIYIATGPNAQARVEIGNAGTYTASTNLTIATPSSWSDDSITATVRQSDFAAGQAYLYVIDGNGNVNTSGYPITFESSSSVTTYSTQNFISLIVDYLKIGTGVDLNSDHVTNTKDLGIMMSKWN